MTEAKEEKPKKAKLAEWADIEKLAKEQAGLITQIYTNAKGAPELFRGEIGNAKVIPSDTNYIVFSDGSRLDIN